MGMDGIVSHTPEYKDNGQTVKSDKHVRLGTMNSAGAFLLSHNPSKGFSVGLP